MKTKRLLGLTSLLVVLMFAFGFGLVPLYNVFCKVTGINGKFNNQVSHKSQTIDTSRTIDVQFTTSTNDKMPWDFYPETASVHIHPGENKRVYFYAKNNSGHRMTIQAIPSISPGLAAKHFKKTQCFCFTLQTFEKDESLHMPVLFHLDRALPADIKTVTLSYTLFDAKTSPFRRHPHMTAAKIGKT